MFILNLLLFYFNFDQLSVNSLILDNFNKCFSIYGIKNENKECEIIKSWETQMNKCHKKLHWISDNHEFKLNTFNLKETKELLNFHCMLCTTKQKQ